MTAFFLIVLGIPLVIVFVSFVFLNGITVKELGIIFLAQLVVAGSSACIVSCANTADVEVWNGRIASKKRQEVNCSHSYPCNCRQVCSGSGKNQSCTTVCDTCYLHSYDVDWEVHTTNGEGFDIDRVDGQGIHEPPRWRAAKVGEPTSIPHSYVNYVKASPETLFRHQGLKEKYAALIPAYPQRVYDYHRLDRLVTVGVDVSSTKAWNDGLSELNAELGRSKQANVIVVLVKDVSDDYVYALEEAWIGGKKNDVVLVISVNDDMKPVWTSVLCWTTNEIFKVKLRDDVMSHTKITHSDVINDLQRDVSAHYKRKPMKDFEYLKSSIVPSKTEWVITLAIGLIIAIALVIVFQTYDVFDDEGRRSSRSMHDHVTRFKRLFNMRS